MPRMIRPAWLSLLVFLVACTAGRTPATGFRDPAAPIWSAAAFSPDLIAGDWQQVAGFSDQTSGCRSGTLRFVPKDGGLAVTGSLCLNGKARNLRDMAVVEGPGRLAVGEEAWWVLWVDSGYRTLAVGTPSGKFGFLLDRGMIPSDRLSAAREVFDFNGYRTSDLHPF